MKQLKHRGEEGALPLLLYQSLAAHWHAPRALLSQYGAAVIAIKEEEKGGNGAYINLPAMRTSHNLKGAWLYRRKNLLAHVLDGRVIWVGGHRSFYCTAHSLSVSELPHRRHFDTLVRHQYREQEAHSL